MGKVIHQIMIKHVYTDMGWE